MRYSARQLVHLAAVVEAGSFTLAAQNLGLSQPALTKSIQQLEARVGASLFRRTTNGAKPTHLGRTLAVHGLSIIASERRAAKDVEDWVSARKGRLLVGAPATIVTHLIPPVISSFLMKHPEVFVKLLVSPLDTLSFRLVSNVIDLYVGIMGMEPIPAGVSAHPIYEDELAIFLRDDHPLLTAGEISVPDLAEQTWIVLPPDKFFRRVADAALLSAGLPTMHTVLEVDSFDGQLNVVRSTDFLCMLPRKMLGRQDGVVALTNVAPLPSRNFTVGIFHRSTEEISTLARQFIEEVRATLPDIAARGA